MASSMKEPGLLGAIVGDVATMPVHWIYDQSKLHEALADVSKPEFNPTLSCPYYNSNEFPNHYEKGQCSPYGEQFVALLNSVRSSDGDADKAAKDFYTWLTKYTGRKDHAGKEFEEKYSEGKRNPDCGADDNQAQCLTKAVIAVGGGFTSNLESLISFHQNNEVAIGCGQIFANFLLRIKEDKMTPREAFEKVIVEKKESLPDILKPDIDFLIKHIESTDTKAMLLAWADEFEKTHITAIACPCPQAFMRTLHVSIHASSYEEGIRKNILIGGDNCSVAIAVGAALGYHFGVPETWSNQVNADIVGLL